MKTILITGANRGIGLELVRQYYSMDWRVIACCRDLAQSNELKKIDEDNNRLIIRQLDIRKIDEIAALSRYLENQSIDILYNNAGIIGHTTKFGELEQEGWLETLKVNTIGPILLIQALIHQLELGQLKIIANMSSSLASISSNSEGGYYQYRSSKTALNSVTKNLAIELKHKGFTVVAIDPGWVKTDMGGKNALITPEESVTGIRHVLNTLTQEDTGTFINYQGKKQPW